jgi:mono/diheme cytochrome c family protein
VQRAPVLFALAVAALGGCKSAAFEDPMTLGGREVSAATLNRGLLVYKKTCIGCHGESGDGNPGAAGDMVPPPRNLRLGVFKFVSVPKGELPTDADLERTIRDGLAGTAMAPLSGLSDEDLHAVVQYVKTFSPRWRRETPGEPIPIPDDPWTGERLARAPDRGFEIYHGRARCWTCHPAYATKAEILELARNTEDLDVELVERELAARGDITSPTPVDTAFGKGLPPDFLGDKVRAVKSRPDVFRTISAGIGGTPMPAWRGSLSVEEVWAVAHYVQKLIRAKGTPEAEALRRREPRSRDTESLLQPVR